MLQAWLVLPALFLAYLVAAPAASFLRRVWHLAAATLAVAVVSLSWMSAVSLVPQSSRPYVDGSCNDSLFTQVFSYNGFSRLGGNALDAARVQPHLHLPRHRTAIYSAQHGIGTFGIAASWDRLLHGPFGHDDAWLLLPAVVASIWLLVLQRHRPRTDLLRAGVILWSVWLVVTFGFFSGIEFLNSYYTAALIPAVAALCGMGAAAAWHRRRQGAVRGRAGRRDGRHRRRRYRARARLRGRPPLDRRLLRGRRAPGGRRSCWARSAPATTAPGTSRSGPRSPRWPCCSARSGPRRSSWRRRSAPSTPPTRRRRSTATPRWRQPASPARWLHCRSSWRRSRSRRRRTSSRHRTRPGTTSWPPGASSSRSAASAVGCPHLHWPNSNVWWPRDASSG